MGEWENGRMGEWERFNQRLKGSLVYKFFNYGNKIFNLINQR